MVRALNRKLLRDLSRLKGQGATIAAVVAAGIASYVASVSTYDSLQYSAATYYERSRLADVFVHCERAPLAVTADLARIPGVRRVEARVVEGVRLEMPGMAEPASGQLVSIPDHGNPTLNDLYLRQGRFPEPGRSREALVHEAFAKAHELGPGDTVVAVIQGRRVRIQVVGLALSPEFVFAVGPGQITMDDRRFGVLWMRTGALAPPFQMSGAFNDAVLALQPGASEPRVLLAVDRVLERYGGLGAVGRDEQTSFRMVQGEMEQLDSMATALPIMFLGVAAFLVNVVLARLLRLQREQIAALKALGYTNREVGLHYVAFALAIVAIGSLLGVALGAWLGDAQTVLYTKYFRFPVLQYRLQAGAVFTAVLVSLGSGVAGALIAVRRAVQIPPAEAMRPEPPMVYRPTVLERVGFHRLLSTSGRMVWRDLERQPVRTALSALAVALSIAILVAGLFSMDSIELVLQRAFVQAQRQHLTATFLQAVPARDARALSRQPGVVYAEIVRSVPMRLRFGHREREIAVSGVSASSTLRLLLDDQGRPVPLPADGIVLSRKLAELLGANPGDVLDVDVLEGSRGHRTVVLAAVVDDYVGLNGTMRFDRLHELLREVPKATEVLMLVDRSRLDELYASLRRVPALGGLALRERMLEQFQRQNTEVLVVFTVILAIFASVIAIAVVYNNARVALSVRSRDLATLRVLGMTRREVSAILLLEQAGQVLLAIVPGLLLGRGLAQLVTEMIDPELFRLPVFVAPRTYVFSVVVVLVSAVWSALLVRRRVDHLDLVGVLKARD